MRARLIILAVLLVFSAQGYSKTIHVPMDLPTIQKAIDAAKNGDTVLVAPGTYAENIEVTYKSITVKSSHGPNRTVIDGGQKGSVARFAYLGRPDTTLSGFTITNGSGTENNAYTYGGGIYCLDFASPTLSGNIITGNKATNGGAGIYCRNYLGTTAPIIVNNIITNNRGTGNIVHGGGICCWYKANAVITNNTIVHNHASHGGGIYCNHTATPFVNNSILWDNTAQEGPEIYIGNACTLAIDHSVVEGGKSSIFIWNGALNWGNGMIASNPLFVDQDAGDFHLLYTSPCRDTGSSSAPGLPEKDYEGDPRIALGNADMGADEFHTHLYYMGEAAPNHGVDLIIVGLPGDDAILYLGADLMDPPLKTFYGDWYLEFPIIQWDPEIIPSTGIISIRARIPPYYPVPSTVPLQALVLDELSNLCTLDVE